MTPTSTKPYLSDRRPHTCNDPLTSVGPELSNSVTSVTFAVSLPVTVTKKLVLPPEREVKKKR